MSRSFREGRSARWKRDNGYVLKSHTDDESYNYRAECDRWARSLASDDCYAFASEYVRGVETPECEDAYKEYIRRNPGSDFPKRLAARRARELEAKLKAEAVRAKALEERASQSASESPVNDAPIDEARNDGWRLKEQLNLLLEHVNDSIDARDATRPPAGPSDHNPRTIARFD